MSNGEFALILSTAMLTMLKLQIILKVAKVEDTAGPRHQGRSCSRLPQGLDNEGDAVSSAFLKGKQHSKKGIFIGFKQRFDLMKVTPINAKPFSKPFDI